MQQTKAWRSDCFVAKRKNLYILSRSGGQPWRAPLTHARRLVICVRQDDVLHAPRFQPAGTTLVFSSKPHSALSATGSGRGARRALRCSREPRGLATQCVDATQDAASHTRAPLPRCVAPPRWLSERLRRVRAGLARLARGSWRSRGPLRGATARAPPLCLICPNLPGALRVDSRRPERLVNGAARVWVRLRCGAAVSRSARRRTARGGAGALPASGWCACTGSRDARAASLTLGTLAPGGGRLGSAGVGLMAPWEGSAGRDGAGRSSCV